MNDDVKTPIVSVLDKAPTDDLLDALSSPLGIILICVLALIFFLIVFVLVKKFSFKRKMNQDRRSLKEDLLIWSNLSRLVSGGKKTKKEKEELCADFKIIKFIFTSALGFIKKRAFKKLATPWYILVGEPLSGKSKLLSAPNLDFERARQDLDPQDEECLHFVVNHNAVFLDVKGKVFFDHWLGGSSAQWSAICELINKYNHKKPLSGIVLTIPADALIADDKSLTLKKANLIVSELSRLTSTLKMRLPCRVVITKADCILGFREYFSSLNQKLKDQALGIDLSNSSGAFIEADFNEKWSNFVSRLKSGVFALFTSKEVIDTSYNGKSRIDVTSYLYAFPQELDALKDNIEIYLNTIFERQVNQIPTLIEGVYLVSSTDQGVNFNKEFATYQNKPVEESLIVDDKKASSTVLFTQNLFTKLLAPLALEARFTKKEQARRNIPLIATCAFLVFLSINYFVGALFGNAFIKNKLMSEVNYYTTLDKFFDRNIIQNSPLLDVDEKGRGVTLFNELMVSDNANRTSRFNFFSETKKILLSQKSLSAMYFPANYLFFDWNNLSAQERGTIYNQLLIDMSIAPATSSFSYNLLNDHSLYSEKRADALFSYMYLSIAKQENADVDGNALLKDCVKKILQYQYPDISQSVSSILTDVSRGDEDYGRAAATQILLEPSYIPSINAGVKELMHQLNNLEAYPESKYQQLRNVVLLSNELDSLCDKFENFDFSYDANTQIIKYFKQYNDIVKDLKRSLEIAEKLDSEYGSLLQEYSLANMTQKSADELDALKMHREAMLYGSYKKYQSIMNSDFDNFLSYLGKRTDYNTSINANFITSAEVSKLYKNSQVKLNSDYEKIRSLMGVLNKNKLLDKSSRKDSENSLNYEYIGNLLDIAYVPSSELTIDLSSSYEFENHFKNVNKVFKKRKEALKKYASSYQNVKYVQDLLEACENILDFSEFMSKVKLTNNLFALYPHSNSYDRNLSEFASKISELDYDFDYNNIFSVNLAREALGNFELLPEYNPKAVNAFINPIVVLSQYSANAQKIDPQSGESIDQFSMYLLNNKALQHVKAMTLDYADSFVNYWANFGDLLKPTVYDYYSFHEFSAGARAYQINAQLADIYNFTYELLNQINVNGLHKKTVSTIKHALANIDNRRKSITMPFTQACTNVLTAWSLLPQDAVKANHYIQALDKKTVRNDFTLVKNLNGSKGNIPWWNAYVNLGTTLLKSESAYEVAVGLNQFQNKLYYFPILADAKEGSMTLDQKSMVELNRKLKTYGFKANKPAETLENEAPGLSTSSDESVENLQEPLLNNIMAGRSDVATWACNVSSIFSLLTDTKSPLETTISIPNLDKQKELSKKLNLKLPNAAMLLRYVDVSYENTNATRFGTIVTSKEDRVLVEDKAQLSDIKLEFYRYSNSEKAEATYTIDGQYAPLRLYLNNKGVYSAKDNCTYVPVELFDMDHNKLVIFIKVTFNKTMLSPQDWPSSVNWPAITEF